MTTTVQRARNQVAQNEPPETTTEATIVSDDKWRDAVKFLLGHGTGPSLTAQDQRKLSACMRGSFADGFSEKAACLVLTIIGWQRVLITPLQ